jgi:RNA polymerase sigma-70 factor (ECF subfamily)
MTSVRYPAEDVAATLTAGDAARLRQLVVEHHDFLWRGLRRLGVPEGEVDDALQSVFVTASRRLNIIEVGRERGYLFGIAVRVASNARRSEARRRRIFDPKAIDDAARAPTADLRDEIETRDFLDHVLAPMPIELRTVFVLFELEEMTAPEIGTLLGLPVGTVASRVRRARELFSARAEELRESLRNEEAG